MVEDEGCIHSYCGTVICVPECKPVSVDYAWAEGVSYVDGTSYTDSACETFEVSKFCWTETVKILGLLIMAEV